MKRPIEDLRAEADRLLALGRYEEAIPAHQTVYDLDPEDEDTAFNLAWLLSRQGQHAAAIPIFDRLILHKGDVAIDAQLARAAALIRLRREGEAEAELQALLAQVPGHLPALLNLGRIEEDRGHREASAAHYRAAHKVAPKEALPLARLLGTLQSGREKDDLIAAAMQLWSTRAIGPLDRCDLGFALAAALDGRGDFTKAWEFLKTSNSAASTVEANAGNRYDPLAQTKFVDRSIATFAPDGARSPALIEEMTPIFVCGPFRSGSSLLEQILGRHSAITGGGEVDIIAGLAKNLEGYPESVPHLPNSQVAELRRAYEDAITPLVSDARFVVDKSPENFLHIGLIRRLFPAAPIIDTRRRREDTLLSCYFQHLAGRDYANTPASLASWHDEYLRLMKHWRAIYEGSIHTVQYEGVVADVESSIRGVLDFLGLEFELDCLTPENSGALVRTASVWQVREPVHSRSVNRAENYPEFLHEISMA